MISSGVELSWLERVPDKDEVPGSSPGTPTNLESLGKLTDIEAQA